ncbi:hypothetical protein IAI10_02185 [Clostridium sp. 19966]|uniref:hypothetical protein n=1 Tax=Clostridium sp. 19966 TaxID=2768166 RepID=UPI0028DDFC60|nr:hypothetical protein [Clostridium sp. 19966]MDT8715466.1 hypothetical protein [Clostridium sp. 19966]
MKVEKLKSILDTASNSDIAVSIMAISLETFNSTTFNQYDYSLDIFARLKMLLLDGSISKNRMTEIHRDISNGIDAFLNKMIDKSVINKKETAVAVNQKPIIVYQQKIEKYRTTFEEILSNLRMIGSPNVADSYIDYSIAIISKTLKEEF